MVAPKVIRDNIEYPPELFRALEDVYELGSSRGTVTRRKAIRYKSRPIRLSRLIQSIAVSAKEAPYYINRNDGNRLSISSSISAFCTSSCSESTLDSHVLPTTPRCSLSSLPVIETRAKCLETALPPLKVGASIHLKRRRSSSLSLYEHLPPITGQLITTEPEPQQSEEVEKVGAADTPTLSKCKSPTYTESCISLVSSYSQGSICSSTYSPTIYRQARAKMVEQLRRPKRRATVESWKSRGSEGSRGGCIGLSRTSTLDYGDVWWTQRVRDEQTKAFSEWEAVEADLLAALRRIRGDVEED